MNYMAEINSFYDKLETNPLSSNAINLWHALIHVANKANWIDKFAVAISVLELKTGLKKKTIERARNELKQKGFIDWKTRAGNQSAEYSMISLWVKFDSQSVPQPVPQSVPQPVAINRLNYTINIKGKDFLIDKIYESVMIEMLNDSIQLERLCMNNQISLEDIHDYVKKYFVKLTNESSGVTISLQEARQHFANWLRIELGKAKKTKTTNKPNYEETGTSIHPALR